MVKDAEANKEADKRRRVSGCKKPRWSIVFSTESLKEHGDKVSAEEKKILKPYLILKPH